MRSGTGQVVDPLRVSVPLDPAEVLHDPVHRPEQAVGVGHHLVHGDTVSAFQIGFLAGGTRVAPLTTL